MKNHTLRSTRTAMIVLALCVVTFHVFFAMRSVPRVAASIAPQGGITYVVNTTNDTIVPDACTNGTSNCSLRGAITAANADSDVNRIQIAIPASDSGCLNLGGVCRINLTQALPNITTAMAINGPGANSLTVRRSNSFFYSVFSITTDGSVTFTGLTISNGSTPGAGGGISNFGGVVDVYNCTISDNQTPMGGAGGGIFNSGLMTIYGSTISNNQAPNGAAGGIRNQGTMNIVNSTVTGNFAPAGGAIVSDGPLLNITNSTITGNTAVNWAGGVQNSGPNATTNVKSSIIAGNNAPQGPDVLGNFVSAGFNLIGKTNDSTGFTAPTDQTGTVASPLNPLLGPLQNNGGPTWTISPQYGSPAIDKGTSIGLTGNLTSDQRGAAYARTFDDPAIPNAAGGNGTDIGAFERRLRTLFDFDGDNKTDVSIFRPSNGQWWISRSSDSSHYVLTFGISTDKIIPADYTGDGKSDVAIYRPSGGEWYILRSEDFSYYAFPFGVSTDTPVPADYDGDGRADPAVFRASSGTWYISYSSSGAISITNFGLSADKPVPADYDGDGKFDIAIYRSPFEWWILRSSNGSLQFEQFGVEGVPVPCDYTGDGKADISNFAASDNAWYVRRSETGGVYALSFGTSSDKLAPADYDADNICDHAFFRPSNNTWNIRRSTGGMFEQTFGTSGDIPTPTAFVP